MKDVKFKNVSSDKYNILRDNCINWCNKYCNNGTASLKGLRQCYDWKDAYIVLYKNVYMVVPADVYNSH